ncbi:hypothetical protein [Prevotella sp. HUN102]|uniref:hypothetical protein n=1 Tax=Prevotella sp. HUN102 TaxID=1392486 RepID=UPI0004910FC0|nr:hypothetical protein [Prevotella sp. HUN102]
MIKQNIIEFDTTDRAQWLKLIVESHLKYNTSGNKRKVYISFNNSVVKSKLTPMHLVTLACLIQHLTDKGWQAHLYYNNHSVDNYIYNDLNFSAYWKGGQQHVEAQESDNVFNLWRIIDSEKDSYAINIEKYFKNTYFRDKDLSAVHLSLVEAFYNVFDHASANNNAFSLIMYDKENKTLRAAIADFGIGITKSVRNFDATIVKDTDALLKAIENNFTVGSTDRNKGKGLDNILSCADTARIYSGNALLYANEESRKAYETDACFPGTLVYFEVDLSKMEEEEILEEFEL